MNSLDQYRHCMALAKVAELYDTPHESPVADEVNAVFLSMPRFWRALALVRWGLGLDALYELCPPIGRPLILFRNWWAERGER